MTDLRQIGETEQSQFTNLRLLGNGVWSLVELHGSTRAIANRCPPDPLRVPSSSALMTPSFLSAPFRRARRTTALSRLVVLTGCLALAPHEAPATVIQCQQQDMLGDVNSPDRPLAPQSWNSPLASGGRRAALFAPTLPAPNVSAIELDPDYYALLELINRPDQALVANWNQPFIGEETEEPAADPEGSGPVTLTLSETTIGTDFYGLVDVSISGLSLGQTVRLEKFKVLNTNGEIDTGAMLVDSTLIRDGVAASAGEVYNFNLLNDVTERDGTIETSLDFWTPTAASIAGEYVFRLSSPQDSFTPVTTRLSITDTPTDQRFVGQVSNNGEPVAGAIVCLLEPLDTNRRLVGATTTDANGNYVLYAPYPDEYDVLAVKPGLVGPIAINTLVVLEEGGEIEQNFELIDGERTISGVLRDATTNEPLPGMELLFLQADANEAFTYGYFTMTWTDANGAFSVPVPAGLWGVQVRDDASSVKGYVTAYNSFLAVTDVTSADTSNFEVTLQPATGLIWGALQADEQADAWSDPEPIGGIEIYAIDFENKRYAWGVTDEFGYYRLAVTPGTWSVGPSPVSLTFYSDFGGLRPQRITVPEGSASVEYNPTARLEAGGVWGYVTDENDLPVGGLNLIAMNTDREREERIALSTYQSDGFYGFYLPAGDWLVMPDPGQTATIGRIFKPTPRHG